ncbi:outer membrane lipoprotein-sorting protein [Marinobacter sp. F3R11]|uniref:outer membrane lipoprotein-sorting protein n=1 Tax=Marinobacter sp. F3R11 TaxID=2267231 RepID=UPI000DEBF887|nr:outer membrane lipoprotein-sorting protein [Marinobacter sp. F3R11]RBW52004.1 RND transporter [Marinobacter sp. F3R11]
MTDITKTSVITPVANGALKSSLPLEGYLRWVVNHRAWIITLILALSAFFGFFAAKQQVIINPSAVVPQSHPYIKATNTIEQIFGSKYMVVIGLTPTEGDALQPHVLEAVKRITDQLYAAPSVTNRTLLSLSSRQAKSIAGNADGFEARPLLADQIPDTAQELEALKATIMSNPIYRDAVISRDWRTATIMLELKENPNGFGAMLSEVHEILSRENLSGIDISLSGNPVFLEQAEVFADRINWLFPIAVLVIGLLHFEAFRTVQGLVLPLITAVLSVVWGVGIMGLMKVPMDIFNSPTPILILAVAAGHAVQLLKRYYEHFIDLVNVQNMEPHAANRLATIQSLAAVGPVLVIAGGIAALGFFSLVVFELETVRAFGIFTGIGLLSAVILEFTFTPAVRASLKPPSAAHIDTEMKPRIWDRLSNTIARTVISSISRRWVLLFFVVLIGVAIAGWPKVHVDNSSKSFFADSLPIQQDDNLLNAQTGGTNVLYIMVDTGQPDGIKNPQVLTAIRTLQADAAARTIVGKTLSIDDFIQRMHQAALGDPALPVPLPDDQNLIAQYLFLYSMSGDPEDFSAYVDYDYQRAKISIMLRTNSNAEIGQLVSELSSLAAQSFPDHVTLSYGGEVAQTLAVTDVMVHSKLLNIGQILFVIFLVAVIAFHSFIAGFLVLSPLLVVLSLVFGVMGYFGVPLNIPNSLISAMAVGIGADYAIYLIYRISEYTKQGQSLPHAVEMAIKTAGKACLFVATAVAGGYAVLMFSYDYKVHVWLSTFIVLAMLTSVLATLTLIPSVILTFKPAFIFRRRSGDRGAVLLVILASIGFLTYSQVGWSAEQIMERNAAVTRFTTSTADAEFILQNKNGSTRTRRSNMSSKLQENGQDTMRLVRFDAPADIRGTTTLLIEHTAADDDMWVYLPAMRRVRRLVASNKKDSFIGTDFSFGDVMGHKVNDWQHSLLRQDVRDGVEHYVVESLPVDEDVRIHSGYSKRVTWVRMDNFATTYVEAFDIHGKPYKTFSFSDIQQVDAENDKWQPMRAECTNLQSGHSTTIHFSNFKVGEPLSDRLFSANNLAIQ